MSNFDVHELEEARAIAGEGRIACNQVLYHLGQRGDRARRDPLVREARRRRGRLHARSVSGAFPGPRSKGGRVLHEIAAAHGATPRQVALRFLVRRPRSSRSRRPGSPEHAAENAGAGSLRLTAAELARIDRAFPRGRRPRQLPTL